MMRVIGGEFRSRRLRSAPGEAARPTPERLRETLFDILAGRVTGAAFLDAYAGTGAVGIEALSRGAAHAYFLERSRRALETIRANLRALGLEARATVAAGPALAVLPRLSADIAFLDPPYELEREYALAMDLLAEARPVVVVAQHAAQFAMAAAYGVLRRVRQVRQGGNALSFYEPAAPAAPRL
jgi:16S rRNA (guanine(966)-N(2))-methyltransferase RsmD